MSDKRNIQMNAHYYFLDRHTVITAGEEASESILQGREPPQFILIPGAIGMSGYPDNRLRIVMVSIYSMIFGNSEIWGNLGL